MLHFIQHDNGFAVPYQRKTTSIAALVVFFTALKTNRYPAVRCWLSGSN